jgi:metal-responsive CopG/Arc/MetJ family transcriptional regulator
MKYVQVSIDAETLRAVDRAAKRLGLKRSEVVRRALREWLQRRTVERLEAEWLASLERTPDDSKRADAWLDAQAWSRK